MRNSESMRIWQEEFLNLADNTERTPEELWYSLKSQLHQMTKEFVPFETASKTSKWKDKGSIPIDKKARQAIKNKEKSHRQLWIPSEYAHGFCVLSETTDSQYKCTDL